MSADDSSPPDSRSGLGLINRKGVREFALKLSRDTRAGKFTRVSAEFLAACEINLYMFVRSRVRSHPSLGKTLR